MRRSAQIMADRRGRTLGLLILLILVVVLDGCGTQGTSATIGVVLATFPATATSTTRPIIATATATLPTVASSPTLGVAATSTPAQPTATQPPIASPSVARSPTAQGTSTTAGVVVRIINFAFDPAVVVVPVGTTVTWRNAEGFHTVLTGDFLLDSPELDVGGSYAFTFTQPGTFTYLCGIHPEMLGVVQVVP